MRARATATAAVLFATVVASCSANSTSSPDIGDERFSGVVKSIHDERPSDGSLVVVVNDNNVEVEAGGMVAPGRPAPPQGTVNGVPEAGKSAEVFAHKRRPHEYTLYGNSDYYLTIR